MTTPESIEELSTIIRSTPQVIAFGGMTKPRLSQTGAERVSTSRLSGIVEYEPSEFTFTALAGTPTKEISDALREQGQYLPFDPMFIEAGSTLGGTLASGISGPGRFRFGGVRDFILGIQFIDGRGERLRMGGKVVKNSAGFDLPKFFVGSLGRFGIVTEITMKVFPSAPSQRTMRLSANSMKEAAGLLTACSNTRWEVDALDIPPGGHDVLLRLTGPDGALDELCGEALERHDGSILSEEEAAEMWRSLREFKWADPGQSLVKIPTTPACLVSLAGQLPDSQMHISAGGNVLFVSTASSNALASTLTQIGMLGLTMRGPAPLWLGLRKASKIESSVKTALDPEGRFPSLNDEHS